MAHREQVVGLKKECHSYEAISEQLSLSGSKVLDIWTRYRQQGEAGLSTAYANCGPKGPKTLPLLRRAALWLKRQHPAWGTPRIHCGLRSRYGHARPSIRTLNRWYAAECLVKPGGQDVRARIGAARAVHNIWQVDAKENLVLADGQPACYLTIVDERSGAWLASLVFFIRTHLPGTARAGA
jgi:hypothetical protein